MIVQEILTAQFDPRKELDAILVELCEMIIHGQMQDSEYFGMVAACVLCPDGSRVYGINYAGPDGKRVHAERAALNQVKNPGPDCMVITTLSPCNQPMDERYGESCTDLLESLGISHVYAGYQDPSQQADLSVTTDNPQLMKLCKRFADTFLSEARKKKRKSRGGYYVGYPWWGGSTDTAGEGGDGGGMEEDYDPNGQPPGPEFKPTMPAGTVKVDVSDVYDWYKLGQHISNLKGLGKHDFGAGPPSTIFSFGSEELEHKFIDALKKTGLTTTDIDPVDPKQPAGMPRQKTDPTYNVAETLEETPPEVLRALNQAAQKNGYRNWADVKANPKSESAVMNVAKLANTILRTAGPHHEKIFYKSKTDENFADGKVKGKSRPGRVKRAGASCKGSVTDLRRKAKNASGERAKMYHWCANMKSGKKK